MTDFTAKAKELANRITTVASLTAALSEAYAQGVEDAAKVAEEATYGTAQYDPRTRAIAMEIRALKDGAK